MTKLVPQEKKISDLSAQINQLYLKLCKVKQSENRSRPSVAATEEQLIAFEDRIGFKLPEDFRFFLQIHNGWKFFAGHIDILSLSKQLEFAMKAQKASVRDVKLHLIGFESSGILIFLNRESEKGINKFSIRLILNDEGDIDNLNNFTEYLERKILELNMLLQEVN